MEFHVFTADCVNNPKNTSYPHEHVISSAQELTKWAQFDHVCADYQDGQDSRGSKVTRCRGNTRFLCSDVVVMDCDNSHSDISSDWKTVSDVEKAFPGLTFMAMPSKSHNVGKKKDNGEMEAARPRFHVYFPIVRCTDAKAYADFKRFCLRRFPYFDGKALDAARFIAGVRGSGERTATFHEGTFKTLDDFMDAMKASSEPVQEAGAVMPGTSATPAQAAGTASTSERRYAAAIVPGGVIKQGERHGTLVHLCNKILKRFGDCTKAAGIYSEVCKLCVPLLDEREASRIYSDCVRYFHTKVETAEGYISPADWERQAYERRPEAQTEFHMAMRWGELRGNNFRYVTEWGGWFCFDGMSWVRSDALAWADVALMLLDLCEACERRCSAIMEQMAGNAADDMPKSLKREKAFYERLLGARGLKGVLECAAHIPALTMRAEDFNKRWELLNTPAWELNLLTGEFTKNNPRSYSTQITAVTPDFNERSEGARMWREFIRTITCGDDALAEFLQVLAGRILFGQVFDEGVIIAVGAGSNGKSTFFNVLAKVLGNYAVNISAEMLVQTTSGSRRFDAASLFGRRFALGGELASGRRLDVARLKQLTSRDRIRTEIKYADGFDFVPTHTMCLYMNVLPELSEFDLGTLRRLAIVPFNAQISPNEAITNYGNILFEKTGGAILAWALKGAGMYAEAGFKLDVFVPECVQAMTEEYFTENDSLRDFVETLCELQASGETAAGRLYSEYKRWADENGYFAMSGREFKREVTARSWDGQLVTAKRVARGWIYKGIALK